MLFLFPLNDKNSHDKHRNEEAEGIGQNLNAELRSSQNVQEKSSVCAFILY